MPIIASSTGSRILMDSGNFIARCYRMVFLGTLTGEWKGQIKIQKKIQLSWEFPTEQHVFDESIGAQPFALHRTYTLNLSEKSNLRKDLQAWRGREFTAEELQSFDVEKVLGAPCMIQVGEKTKDDGDKINIIQAIASIPKGTAIPVAINENFLFSVDEFDPMKFELLPDWMKDEIKTSAEYKDLQQGEVPLPPSDPIGDVSDSPADDLPF